ncbi:MAG: LVIVD repeat-containing protein [Burkholderiales bacterium]
MAQSRGIREVGYLDCVGGGQVTVDRNIAYLGHVKSPHGTTMVDVSDPKRPKIVHELQMPVGTHSHKVRVANDIMITNREVMPFKGAQSPDGFKGGNAVYETSAPEGFKGGLAIYDVSTPGKPKHITNWETGGTGMAGVHRFDFDGRYAYISPTVDGYLGNIVMILDLKDPAKPEEVGRW